MNGVKMEIDEPLQSAGAGLTCCLIDNGIRCHRPTGNASYSKRIAKTVTQRRLKLIVDQMVCFWHLHLLSVSCISWVFSGYTHIFCVILTKITNVHALRLISLTGKRVQRCPL